MNAIFSFRQGYGEDINAGGWSIQRKHVKTNTMEEFMRLHSGPLDSYCLYLGAHAIRKKRPGVWTAMLVENRTGKSWDFFGEMKSASQREIVLLGANTVLERFDSVGRIAVIVDDAEFVGTTFPKAMKKLADNEPHFPWTIARLANEISRLDISAHMPYLNNQKERCKRLRLLACDRWDSQFSRRRNYLE